MIKYKAKFYDGKSSKAFDVKISINFDSLSFEHGNSSISWLKNDVDVEFVNNTIHVAVNEKEKEAFLKIDDAECIALLKEKEFIKLRKTYYHQWIKKGYKVHIPVALFSVLLILAFYRYVLPEVGEKAANLIPESYDEQVGNQFYDKYIYLEEENVEKSVLAQSFLHELAIKNKENFKVTIVESDQINAFALPNGRIVIFTGLLNELESYNELVALLGHEISHVHERHSIKIMSRNLISYVFLSAILNDVNGLMTVITNNLDQLESLTFSRGFESEADEMGFDLMRENKIDPEGMIALFERLEKHELNVPEFFSSHPLTQNRKETIKRKIKEEEYFYEENLELESLFKNLKN